MLPVRWGGEYSTVMGIGLNDVSSGDVQYSTTPKHRQHQQRVSPSYTIIQALCLYFINPQPSYFILILFHLLQDIKMHIRPRKHTTDTNDILSHKYEGVSKSPRTMLITRKSLVVHEFPARMYCGGVL